MKYIYIGRFQPFHKGHRAIVDLTMKMMKPEDTFTIIIGSADQQETERNPLSASKRQEMISKELKDCPYPITIWTINDSPYNYDLWVEHLCAKMLGFKSATPEDFLKNKEVFMEGFSNICIVGMENVEEYIDRITRYYTASTEHFDLGIKCHVFSEIDTQTSIHGSTIRNLVKGDDGHYSKRFYSNIKDFVSETVLNCLRMTNFPLIIWNAYEKGINYAVSTGCKYNSCFVTVDNIVHQLSNNKVLLIKRKDNGRLAIPGGFAEPYMDMKNNALRELEEETSISKDDLKDAGVSTDVEGTIIDAPYRDPRSSSKCNFVSIVYVWQQKILNAEKLLETKAKAGDDAAEVVWLGEEEVEDLPACCFHADHKKILCKLLGWDYFKA